MIKIPLLSLIIFMIICCIYNIQSNALKKIPPIKLITSYRNLVTTEAPVEATAEPIPYHKMRFSLFYRKKLRKSL